MRLGRGGENEPPVSFIIGGWRQRCRPVERGFESSSVFLASLSFVWHPASHGRTILAWQKFAEKRSLQVHLGDVPALAQGHRAGYLVQAGPCGLFFWARCSLSGPVGLPVRLGLCPGPYRCFSGRLSLVPGTRIASDGSRTSTAPLPNRSSSTHAGTAWGKCP